MLILHSPLLKSEVKRRHLRIVLYAEVSNLVGIGQIFTNAGDAPVELLFARLCRVGSLLLATLFAALMPDEIHCHNTKQPIESQKLTMAGQLGIPDYHARSSQHR